jgi:5-methylthioadenosine/S-adenosylhomocysteine deaminase
MDADDRLLPAADIRIEGGKIAAIGEAMARPGDSVIDCRDALVIPGLVNTHTHACASLFRGLTEDLPREYWRDAYGVPDQERFQPEDFQIGALASCLEFLLNGVTCIADRWGGMDFLGAVLEQSGVRAILGHTLTDNRGPADWKTVDALLERWGTKPGDRITVGIAPHAPDTCSDDLLRACARRSDAVGARVFLHLAQSRFEVEKLKARGYAGAVAALANNGLANPQTVAAHCIYVTPSELDDWHSHRISVAHCPASNLKIEARTVPLHRLVGRTAVGIGTDWAASDNAMDMLAETRLAALVGKQSADDPAALPVRTMLRLATIEGARVLGLDQAIGSVEVGKHADLVVLGLDLPEANPRHDLAANVLYSMTPRSVRDVLVDGQVLVRGGKLLRGDLAELKRARDRRWPVWRAT